jgi:hypothetical protein
MASEYLTIVKCHPFDARIPVCFAYKALKINLSISRRVLFWLANDMQ